MNKIVGPIHPDPFFFSRDSKANIQVYIGIIHRGMLTVMRPVAVREKMDPNYFVVN